MGESNNDDSKSYSEGRPAVKRRKLVDEFLEKSEINTENVKSMFNQRAISPPAIKRACHNEFSAVVPDHKAVTIPSPVKLTRICDISDIYNQDTITLHDIIGDASITELWQFNYLFNIDFLMSALHVDVRVKIPITIVHGFWRHNDASRSSLMQSAEPYPNVKLVAAGRLQAFGTHHSKLMVIFRRNKSAEIVIHTANMIARDWANMTQAVWRSPLLRLERDTKRPTQKAEIGETFKKDFLAYLGFYEARTLALVEQLKGFDFSEIRAVLVASVPKGVQLHDDNDNMLWGWPRLKKVLRSVPIAAASARPVIVSQISSIATLGKQDTWLKSFLAVLGSTTNTQPQLTPRYRIIFPTADEIRRSADGYQSGHSIHTKIQSPAQQAQLRNLMPMLCYWAGDGENVTSSSRGESMAGTQHKRLAGRRRAAPHIKTYIRFSDESMTKIDWAMVTSANLSTQAWGDLAKGGSVKVSSYEIGVVIWPQLLTNEAEAVMMPTFMTDKPEAIVNSQKVVIGFRMPYDLPLTRYVAGEVPWCATSDYMEPDWKGETWIHG